MPPDKVRCIHVEGSGCYGHNGADDAAADAALIARALPGRPVRVQWMREQEHAWEPFGPAMVTKLKASLDGNGKIADWHFDVWSNTHSMRPGGAGSMLAAQHMAQPFAVPAPRPLPLPEGGGDRNVIPIYKFPNAQGWCITSFRKCRFGSRRCVPSAPITTCSRSKSPSLPNSSELAGIDPVEFRLNYLEEGRRS